MTEIFNSTELRRELHPLAELGLNTKTPRSTFSITLKNRR